MVRNAPHLSRFRLAAMFFICFMLMLSLQNLPAANRIKGESSSLEANENEECTNTSIILNQDVLIDLRSFGLHNSGRHNSWGLGFFKRFTLQFSMQF